MSLWQNVNVKKSKFNRSARASCIYGVKAAETRFRCCCLSEDFQRRMDLCDIIQYYTNYSIYILFFFFFFYMRLFISNWIKRPERKMGTRFQFLLKIGFKRRSKSWSRNRKKKKRKYSTSAKPEHWEDKSVIAERDGLFIRLESNRVPITSADR